VGAKTLPIYRYSRMYSYILQLYTYIIFIGRFTNHLLFIIRIGHIYISYYENRVFVCQWIRFIMNYYANSLDLPIHVIAFDVSI